MAKVIINACFGGFGLSDAAYEWLIAHGVPVQKYILPRQDNRGLYLPEPRNDGRVIFDRELTLRGENEWHDRFFWHRMFSQRYWDTWTNVERSHPLVVQCVEELGDRAAGDHAKLKVIEIPEGVDYMIEEYDGREHVAEVHRTWA